VLARTEALAHLRLASDVAGLDVEELALPVERDIVTGGIRLHYLDWGSSDRAALLFLHGGALTAHTWDLVCLALRGDFHCVALDLRGHGDSEWSPTLDYGPDAHARDIGGVIEQLELRRPVLIGQSLGGLSAMIYAARAPDQPAGIAMVDVGPNVQSSGVKRVADFVMGDPARGSLEDFVDRARAFNPRRDPRLLRYSLLHNLRPIGDRSWAWKYDRRPLTPEYLASVRGELERLGDIARAVTCPVLVVRGAESDALTDSDAASFAASLPDGRWSRVENAGHTVQGDNPRGLTEVLTRFLAEVGRS
jgi:pimeloyl-ACP methyl ester carboxylesterase